MNSSTANNILSCRMLLKVLLKSTFIIEPWLVGASYFWRQNPTSVCPAFWGVTGHHEEERWGDMYVRYLLEVLCIGLRQNVLVSMSCKMYQTCLLLTARVWVKQGYGSGCACGSNSPPQSTIRSGHKEIM